MSVNEANIATDAANTVKESPAVIASSDNALLESDKMAEEDPVSSLAAAEVAKESSIESTGKKRDVEATFSPSEKENAGDAEETGTKVAKSNEECSPSKRVPKTKQLYADVEYESLSDTKKDQIGLRFFMDTTFRDAFMGKHPGSTERAMSEMAAKVWGKMEAKVKEGFVKKADKNSYDSL